MLILYATGHSRHYQSDEEEIRGISSENAMERGAGLALTDPENPALHWWPSSLDFRVEARRHGRPVGVGSLEEFVGAIRRRRNLETVLFFGHAGPDLLKFGDTNYIRGTDIRGRNRDVSSRFAENGRIILYACNAAHTADFLSALANAFHVTVCGFPGGVRWNLRWDGTRPNRRITWRGISRSSGDDSLPANYRCYPPINAAQGEQHTHLPQHGVLTGATRFAGVLRSGSRRPGPIGQA